MKMLALTQDASLLCRKCKPTTELMSEYMWIEYPYGKDAYNL